MAFLTPNATGEAPVLASFLRNQLAQVRSTTHGLSDADWHRRSTVSAFTLADLIDHVGLVAQQYGVGIEATVGGPDDYSRGITEGEPDPVDGLTGEQLLAAFDERVAGVSAQLDRIVAGEIPLDGKVPVPAAPWFPADLTHWEVRWVLVHLCTEIARHAGHADIIREAIDGKQAYELNDLADGIEPVDWQALSQEG